MPERTVAKSMAPRHAVHVLPGATVYDAACAMTKSGRGHVLVMDPGGAMLGILTEHDMVTRVVARALDGKTTRVADVMTRNPHTVTPDTTVSQAILIMLERGFRHLPVIAQDGQVVGVFSSRDAMPREIDRAMTLAQFHDQVNDALG